MFIEQPETELAIFLNVETDDPIFRDKKQLAHWIYNGNKLT